jgi:hypothetical protein
MIRRASLTWLVPFGAVAAFAIGVSAEQTRSQGVVTPADPVFGVQDPAPDAPEPAEPEVQGPARGGRGGGGRGQQGPRPYTEVVTRAARTDDGVFKVHRVGDAVYYEIPKAQLHREFLWVTQIKRMSGRPSASARGRPLIRS